MKLAIQLFGVLALAVTTAAQAIERTSAGSHPSTGLVGIFNGMGRTP